MARVRGRPGMGEWVKNLGEQIGSQLGEVIAQSVQRTLETSIDVSDLARRLGAGLGGRRGRRPSGARAVCGEPGCGKPVLDQVFPFDQTAHAHALMAANQHKGKMGIAVQAAFAQATVPTADAA